jgi:predicted alpha-1,2-mannosidase
MRHVFGRSAGQGAARLVTGIGVTVLLVIGSLIVGSAPPPAAAAGQQAAGLVRDPASYVDPFVGTGNGGEQVGEINNFPGPATPFGMLQWSPDTLGSYAGYRYSDSQIRGFSLTHASVGCRAFGDVPILPTVGPVGTQPWNKVEGFSHASEAATPGSYAVTLADSGVRAELTSATRTGLGRFTFPASEQAQVLVKAGASLNGNSAASVRMVGNDEVVGSATTGNFCGKGNKYTVYFALKFDRPFTASGSWDGTSVGDAKEQSGPRSGAYVTFDTRQDPTVDAKVAISYVSTDAAEANMRAEIAGWDLATVRDAAYANWNRQLSRIQVGGGTADQRTTFYSALYRSLLYPTTFSDVDGRYPGFDGQIHTLAPGQRAQYANFSAWDTYRSLAALQGLVYPEIGSDLAQSLVNDASQGGWLPKWPMANSDTGVMDGDNAVPLIASLYAFGARNFDVATALRYMVKGATTPPPADAPYPERQGVADYQRLGYVPNDRAEFGHVHLGASQTLEYSIDDFAISRLAAATGDGQLASTFAARAQNWQNVFDPSTGYLRPKDSRGAFPSGPGFVAPPAGQFGQDGFDEGNAAQYNYLVPQNMRGLVDAMGGDAAVGDRADQFFQQLNAGPNAPYQWSGNEIDFATPWLYDYVGQPWKTQAVVRRIETELFSATPNGEPGNDDLGAQSSWYVWAAIGLYPVTPGTTDLAVHSPLFSSVRLHLPSGHDVSMDAPAAATDRPYISHLTLDDANWDRAYLPSRALERGAHLAFTLSNSPDTSWATDRQGAPPSYQQGQASAIGFASPTGQTIVQPGQTMSAQIGAQSDRSDAPVVDWTADPPDGITVTAPSGRLQLGGAGRATQTVTITVSAQLQSGFYTVPFHFRTPDGRSLPGSSMVLAVPAADGAATTCDTLGPTDDEHGLSRMDNGDGRTQAVTTAGEPGRTTLPGSGYIYFNVDNQLVPGGTYHAVVTVRYFDHGTDTWALQYDSNDPTARNPAYKQAPSIRKTGTDTWKTATITLDDAHFGGRENGSSDFRLANGDGNAETIAQVHVSVSGDNVLAMHLCPDS